MSPWKFGKKYKGVKNKMVILNPIKCKKCGQELQPGDILIGIDEDDLVSKCGFCGEEISRK